MVPEPEVPEAHRRVEGPTEIKTAFSSAECKTFRQAQRPAITDN